MVAHMRGARRTILPDKTKRRRPSGCAVRNLPGRTGGVESPLEGPPSQGQQQSTASRTRDLQSHRASISRETAKRGFRKTSKKRRTDVDNPEPLMAETVSTRAMAAEASVSHAIPNAPHRIDYALALNATTFAVSSAGTIFQYRSASSGRTTSR